MANSCCSPNAWYALIILAEDQRQRPTKCLACELKSKSKPKKRLYSYSKQNRHETGRSRKQIGSNMYARTRAHRDHRKPINTTPYKIQYYVATSRHLAVTVTTSSNPAPWTWLIVTRVRSGIFLNTDPTILFQASLWSSVGLDGRLVLYIYVR